MARFAKSFLIDSDSKRLADWLSAAELNYYGQLRSAGRQQDWLCGRYAAKELVSKYLIEIKIQTVERREIEIFSDPDDGPRVALAGRHMSEICLSISHSAGTGFAGLTISEKEGRIGVDVQKIRKPHPKLHERILTLNEYAQLQQKHFDNSNNFDEGLILLWSLKESAYKALQPVFKVAKAQLEVYLDPSSMSAEIAVIQKNQRGLLHAEYERVGNFYYTHAIAAPHVVKNLTQD